MATNANPIADVTIIGSGISCTATLIALFERLLAGDIAVKTPLNITVVEKYPELWKGIPYGERSSVNALTITTINDFFTSDAEREKFFEWFIPNIDHLLKDYAAMGGTTAATWLENNREALDKHEWNSIYLPRHIIGKYIVYKLGQLKHQVESRGLAKITTVHGEAVAVKNINGIKNVVISVQGNNVFIPGDKIVIAIGSAPEKRITNTFDGQDKVLYINNLHAKNLEDTAKSISEKLSSAQKGERNILILGSNASSIELLYILNNTRSLAGLTEHITLISLGGKLPGKITYETHAHEITADLDKLSKTAGYSLDDLVTAAADDIFKVSGETVSVTDVDQIMAKTIGLLAPLDEGSKKLFYAVHGVQLARLFRRSGTDYKKASADLALAQKLELIKGAYADLSYNSDGSTTLFYRQQDGLIQDLTQTFKVVLNCMGADDLQNTSSALIKDLIDNNGCKINLSNKAFEVSDRLEAAPGIYVIGPLAGGNFNKRLYFWHLENASRIMYLSGYLAEELIRS